MATLKKKANLIEEQEQKYGKCITSDKASSGFQAQDEARSVCVAAPAPNNSGKLFTVGNQILDSTEASVWVIYFFYNSCMLTA